MARTSQTRATKRGGRRNTTNNTRNTRNHKENDLEYMALKQEAERRERILADRRRTAAKWRPKIPEVRKVNFENFKNRFQDIDEPDYAIDVLMSGTGTQAQIRREHGLRRREEMARLRQKYMYYPGGGVIETPHRKTDAYEKARREKDSQPSSDSEIQRIRIQSQPILGHLTALMNDTEKRSSPRTFMRPFKTLVHFQPKMREILATLEDKWADFEDIGSESSEVVDVAEETEAEVVDEEEAAEDGDDVASQTSEASSIDASRHAMLR
ncbi:hypothetical protein BFJ68_g4535 [Fusarium oxysporum]|uniref:Uncharacterized protein n=1 Tax=Fusarium oxysporum TaxID=5507 RepID=A0A420RKV7_FUSOX|nr:hypothetical protein BFJ68_g4535 [Fusarium oxysporum]